MTLVDYGRLFTADRLIVGGSHQTMQIYKYLKKYLLLTMYKTNTYPQDPEHPGKPKKQNKLPMTNPTEMNVCKLPDKELKYLF